MHAPWPFGRHGEHGRERPVLGELAADGATTLPGVFAAGHLVHGGTGLAGAVADGARVGALLARRLAGRGAPPGEGPDLVVIGAGPAGCAAALAALAQGLRCVVLEAGEPFQSIVSAPADHPIDGVPTPPGAVLRGESPSRDALLAELRSQVATLAIHGARAERVEPGPAAPSGAPSLRVVVAGGAPLAAAAVVLAVGRFGCPRRLGVPGERLAHVRHGLPDPAARGGRRTLVVGGGECAAQAALHLAEAGAEVTLVHRGAMLTRPGYETLARLSERLAGAPLEPWRRRRVRSEIPRRAPGPGTISLRLVSSVLAIGEGSVSLREGSAAPVEIAVDEVFVLAGRHSPAELARASGLAVAPDA